MQNKTKKKKKKKYIPPKVNRDRIMPTANAQRIYEIMKSRKIRGKYKDHVIIIGSQLIDWLGSYHIRIEVEGKYKKYGVDGIALVHKSKLKNIIGNELAEKFWKNGMRTNIGIESRRDGCIKIN